MRQSFTTRTTSVCRICHGGCLAELHTRNNKLVRVKPARDSVFNRNRMCVKGLSTKDIIYHPARLTVPLKRKGDRGSGEWQAMDWDTVLDEIASRLDRIRQSDGPEAIAIGQGTGRHFYMHAIRFANTLGTPNWYEPGLANCFIPRITVSNLTYGGLVTPDYFGPVRPKTILFWGCNPLVSGPDGNLPFSSARALKAGSYGIAIDPRKSRTAKKCREWLAIRPGTDAALALAMAHVIIQKSFYNKDFIENWTTGFDRLAAHVASFTPEWAQEITGIDRRRIESAAERYALDGPSVLQWGVSIEQNPNSLQTVRALSVLRGLTGNVDNPGGDILGMNLLDSYPTMRNVLGPEAIKKRIGYGQYDLLSGFGAVMPSAHIPGVFKAMRTGDPYPIKALLNLGSNPLTTIANPKGVYAGLDALELLVAVDLFMTPTTALADYILPGAFWPEVDQLMEMPLVAANAVIAQQKVIQTGECRQCEDILIDLARRLNLPGAEEDLESLLNHQLAKLGITFAELKERTLVFPPHQYWKFESRGFKTPSGKVELFSRSLERFGYSPLPTYKEPPESPVSDPDTAKDFPYVLSTGSRRSSFFHSEQRQIPNLRDRHPDPLAEVHPDTAADCGVEHGQWVCIRSPRGCIRMKLAVTPDIKKGVVSIDHGWWFPEKPGPDYGVWESNANLLTSDSPPYDNAFGSYQLRGLLCKIEKISSV